MKIEENYPVTKAELMELLREVYPELADDDEQK
eukprot:CAMPEP_0170568536 /NCGR_PEP_ID=MMETSP0211-20121228/81265_1 /TAXON_ID=311385 /ORGANISM="Pseudokeronopsis sp., Strain OXSARD2" /LENGTH=32 /DNA_ID= /DNA_START= /DNA_END= /DNA_ORIENTATION=